jgi:hypothetical protein
MKKKKKELKKKYKVIKKLVPKAGFALKNEFYLDASWILSSILESKLRRILTLMINEHPGLGYGLQQCLRRIKFLQLKGTHPLLLKHFEIRLIDELRVWTTHRNNIYKSLIDTHVSKARMKKMAMEGIMLYQELNTGYKNLKKDWTKDLLKESSLQVESNEPTTPN